MILEIKPRSLYLQGQGASSLVPVNKSLVLNIAEIPPLDVQRHDALGDKNVSRRAHSPARSTGNKENSVHAIWEEHVLRMKRGKCARW